VLEVSAGGLQPIIGHKAFPGGSDGPSATVATHLLQ
jgi:hypothetical protein